MSIREKSEVCKDGYDLSAKGALVGCLYAFQLLFFLDIWIYCFVSEHILEGEGRV